MAIRPAVAQIINRIQGLNQLQQLSRHYQTIHNRARQAITTVGSLNRVTSSMGVSFQRANRHVQNFNSRIHEFSEQNRRAGNEVRFFTGGIVNLTKSMILFSVLLPVVQFPSTFAENTREAIQAGADWETQITKIKALMGATPAEINKVDMATRRYAATLGLTTQELDAALQIFSTINVVAGRTGNTMEDIALSTQALEKLLKFSRALGTDLNNVWEPFFTVMAAGNFTINESDQILEELFKTMRFGRIEAREFAQEAPMFLSQMISFMRNLPTETKLERAKEWLQIFSAATLVQGPERAATGLQNIMMRLSTGASEQGRKVIQEAAKMGVDISASTLFQLSPTEILQRIESAIGPQGMITSQAITLMQRNGLQFDEQNERLEIANRLYRELFGEMRAQNTLNVVFNQNMEKLVELQRDWTKETDLVIKGNKDWEETVNGLNSQIEGMRRNFNIFLKDALKQDIVSFNRFLKAVFAPFTPDESGNVFTGQGVESVFEAFKLIVTNAFNKLNNWFMFGEGRQKTSEFAFSFGKFLSEMFVGAFGGQGGGLAFEIGKTFADGFINGLLAGLTGGGGITPPGGIVGAGGTLVSLMQGPLRSLFMFLALNKLGMARLPALAVTAGIEGSMHLFGKAGRGEDTRESGFAGAALALGSGLAISSLFPIKGLTIPQRLFNLLKGKSATGGTAMATIAGVGNRFIPAKLAQSLFLTRKLFPGLAVGSSILDFILDPNNPQKAATLGLTGAGALVGGLFGGPPGALAGAGIGSTVGFLGQMLFPQTTNAEPLSTADQMRTGAEMVKEGIDNSRLTRIMEGAMGGPGVRPGIRFTGKGQVQPNPPNLPAPANSTTNTENIAPSAAITGIKNRIDFINRLAGPAQEAAKKVGLPASLLLAIAANETGFGSSQVMMQHNNFFGIKGTGNAGFFTSPTWEIINGQRVNTTSNFAAFSDPATGLEAFMEFLSQNSRYKGALEYLNQTGDIEGFMHRVNQAGYATDPNWSNKVLSLMQQIEGQVPQGHNGILRTMGGLHNLLPGEMVLDKETAESIRSGRSGGSKVVNFNFNSPLIQHAVVRNDDDIDRLAEAISIKFERALENAGFESQEVLIK